MLIEAGDLRKEYRVYRHREGAFSTIKNLINREYRLIKAVDGISFSISKGELIGYLGPNGAGKSTTIKMLTGILQPSGGTLLVGGLSPMKDRIKHVARLGVVFGQRTNLWWDLPVIESLNLIKHIYKVSDERYRRNLKDFGSLLGIDEFVMTPVRSLSLGQRMRADLAASLLHDPEILFLDEPTIGLDVLAKERIRTFIKHINEEHGTTVILTTHDLGDVSQLCRRVMMIDKGKLLYDGSLAELVERFGGSRQLVVELAEDYENVDITGSTVISRNGRTVTYSINGEGLAPLMEALSARLKWVDLSLKEPDIEATIKRIYAQGM